MSLAFFWIKGFTEIDYRFIKTSKPNTILGFIPAGKDVQSIPLKNVSSATISSSYKLIPMLIGFVIFMSGVGLILVNFFAGMIYLLLGVAIFGSGVKNTLCIQRAGSDYLISVPFFEKEKLYDIQDKINQALASDVDKTDLSLYHSRIVED